MIDFIGRLVRRHPLQSSLILFNMGVFTWLQTTGTAIADKLGISTDSALSLIPDWLRTLTHNSLGTLQSYYGSSGWAWLIGSMLIMMVISFIKGVIKFILVVALIAIGIWLIYRHQELLGNLKLS
ncbi:hypothetical protein [Streptococcus dentiloxodontae]